MRWLTCALLSVFLFTGLLVSCSDRSPEQEDGALSGQELDDAERLALMDARLDELGQESADLAGYFSETGVGEQLGVFDSRLLQLKVALEEVRTNLDAEDPLLRDTAARTIRLHEETLAAQERAFSDFRTLFGRARPQYINAFGRHRRVNDFLAHLIDVGTPCPEEQATTRELSQVYLNGRRFLFAELGNVLAGKEADETLVSVAISSFQQTYDGLQDLYEKLVPVDVELNRMKGQEATVTSRLEWARATRAQLEGDPWLESPEADLEVAAKTAESLAQRMRSLEKNALGADFIEEARQWVEEATKLIRRLNGYVTPARKAGLPLPH